MEATDIRRTVELEDRHWWYRERRAMLARELRRLGPPGTALDIGAAGGGNTRVLVEHGWDALAADYSETAVELALRRGLRAIHADACDLPLPGESFDLVLAFDVLEHIEDDRTAARELVRVLRPGGRALITVPCDMALWSAHDVASFHFRRYAREELSALLRGAGLVVDRMWSWNVLMRPVVAWRRKRTRGSDVTDVPLLVNLGLGAVVAAERYLPVKSFPGVTLVVRAHRPS
ncbi:Methyltransferase domain-containing protein [Microbispora rosea]|uniref:Methyltransferase domain-containing protein n=1 Tax=Microbispora rosea TaxID=58117 RepID=A0A1N7E2D8_9ACTN|nr:class I SAM-dependent methyltransferase [Microbispora rosea]GIH47976.1 methyltransferase [Microbispora rosea subsp. rosea]SIR82292.1 Methyltransferase domain-containing protein [Microbispora rosea]